MKKFLVGLSMFFVFAIALPTAAYSQICRKHRVQHRSGVYHYANQGYTARYDRRTNRRGQRLAYYDGRVRRPSFYRRHRNLINIGLGTGGGALIGGMLGGRKGALIGALAGAGGSALYTYKLNPKKRRYYRR
ncbi:MAG: hypothetical protein IPM25_12605 [Chloracidobacterium sp.]|nr:hypothetical protein [Chloracidobacterium sp.]